MRLLAATATSGVLELVTDEGSLTMDVDHGWTEVPPKDELDATRRILSCSDGAFRFEPGKVVPFKRPSISLSAYAEAIRTALGDLQPGGMTDIEVERLVSGEITELAQSAMLPNIHLLPTEPPVNPLDDFLADLADEAPQELLFAQVGVVAPDPRIWRGALENEWRRRGWEVKLFGSGEGLWLDDLDVLVVHHASSVSRTGNEKGWLELVRRAATAEPPTPVVWAAPLGDPLWMQDLVLAGVSFLLPTPPGDGIEVTGRFNECLTALVDRQLRSQLAARQPVLPAAVTEFVDALLHEADSEQAVGALLLLASGQLTRGALLMVEETAIRCRAGFGYPLAHGSQALPRGLGLLERVIRSGEPLMRMDGTTTSSRRLAAVLGVDQLPSATAVIPLAGGGSVVGVLVADREGEQLPDLSELVVLAGRLGGVVLQF
jgi:hypothetical protein